MDRQTDRQTDTRRQLIPALARIMRVKKLLTNTFWGICLCCCADGMSITSYSKNRKITIIVIIKAKIYTDLE